MRQALDRNPLRQAYSHWLRECGGDPDWPFARQWLLNGYPSTLWWFKGLLVGREAPPRSRHTARLNTSYRYVTIDLAWSEVVLCKAQPVFEQLAKTRSRLDDAFATREQAHSAARPRTKPNRS